MADAAPGSLDGHIILSRRLAQRGDLPAIDVLGAEGLDFEAGYELRQSAGRPEGAEAVAKYLFLRSRANSIEGGTSEIMRNILGERVLGLPGEPRVDKDVPWKDVPRS